MVIKISDYLKSKQRTYDGRTHSSLCDKIKEMVHKANTTKDTDEDITKFIIGSFADGDVIMIYNELGHMEWTRFMKKVISEEIHERNVLARLEKSKKWWW